ncbi:DUF6544 family protein [uncultured Methanospirillum sp.]|uniref:DUF6544 family protein n=1 Tax=uncultured Methanospirillum sp. TaxID=262503 RepID=UPI0029C8B18C|nr:DUF6544 family protein [uncultured Methanospirillum sp.]
MAGYLMFDLVFALFFVGAAGFCIYSYLLIVQQREQQKMLCSIQSLPAIVLKSVQTPDLPVPVKRYFHLTCIDQIERLPCLEIQISGVWRPKKGLPSIPIHGNIFYAINRPCFLELLSFSTWPHILKTILFKQSVNEGQIEERFLSVFSIRKESGFYIQKMGLLKYFFEAVWFPWIFRPSLYLNWEPIDDLCARFTVSDSLIPLNFIVKFDESGLIKEMISESSIGFFDDLTPNTTFIAIYGGYCEVRGMLIPREIKIFRDDRCDENLYQHLILVSYQNTMVYEIALSDENYKPI